ncbi:glutamine--fructose-6-phosphate transaminase (isomerizing) [Olivibacter ginsenosidimutans]|uniref:Glutamine--fructose-6-phosphate aminotransferase [isomerizing] n=1 Tax=Olivibacter ginsenosidimutans TaxID=1176537 RepID=A0ABP9AE62_9SPHI
MCGIVGYIGYRNAWEVIIKGLKRLEYRGYDSAGIALMNEKLHVYKRAGKVSDLETYAGQVATNSSLGMGHTRWATHGAPNDRNAHPHASSDQKLAIVHNGIIENYASIKAMLIQKGQYFVSDTDTEVLIKLIEQIQLEENSSLQEAVRLALTQVSGAFALVIASQDDSDLLIAARRGSPMVIGIGEGEYFIASDASPMIEYTKHVYYPEDNELIFLHRNEIEIRNLTNVVLSPYIQELELELEALEKGGYDHFMLKEIYEQPHSIANCMRGRIDHERKKINLGGISEYAAKLLTAKRIIIVSCGTSWHAGLVGEYLIEEYARIPVEVEYASEFRYRHPIINQDDIVIAISQSGETADTIAAIELAKRAGATILGICNVVGSSIPRLSHTGMYTHAGPEIGVASTKAFTAQVTALSLLALYLAQQQERLPLSKITSLLTALETAPALITTCFQSNALIQHIAGEIKDSTNCLFLGRGINFPVALEGALKLKEISYIHAEGYPAAEMKHGPIALIDEQMPVIVIATKDSSYDKIISNIQEVKARKGKIIAIITEGDTVIRAIADYIIEIPPCEEALTPILATIPLQLLAYHIAVMRGCNVDQPRNLAKSVTVE